MASINLRVDAFGICPQFPLDESHTLRGVGSVEEKVIHGRRLGHRQVRSWTLTWDVTAEGQMWHLKNAFTAAGINKAMNFIPADGGGIVEVRMTEPLEVERLSATAWKATTTVEELIK